MNKKGTRFKETRMHYISVFVVLAIFVSMFSVINFVENAKGHIPEGEGNPLQLYSYFDADANKKISFDQFTDNGIGRDAGNYDEWEGAYVRNITITNFNGDDRFCFLFLANDDSYLYVGVVYQADNTGAANYVRIYFDEGDGSGGYDGSHDDALTANNENYIESDRGENLDDGFYNGAAWQSDTSIDIADVKVAWGTSYMNYEFKIPLDNGVDGATGSDLNVASTDELGIFLEIGVLGVGSGVVHYWDLTGNDPTDVSAYADLQLGIQRKTATVYSTFANTGNPIIDGDISNDFAYANAYSRDLTLTNFTGGTLSTTLYMCENPTSDDIFIGVVIYTDSSDSADFLRIYTDQNHSWAGPYGDKDGVLSDGGGQTENFEQVSGDNGYIDGFWDSGGNWLDDGSAMDATDGEGAVTFVNFPGTTYDRYEFEFRLPYSPISSYQVTGAYDLYVLSPQIQGFLIEFFDASATPGEQYFYWDLTTNLNSIKTRSTAGGIFLSTGWAYLQTGGPALKPITPISGSTVFGTDYVFRVEAEDEDGFDGVNFVGFQVEGETSWISLVRESATNGIWYTYWDTTAYSDGVYNITIVGQDNEGVVVKKIISITIVNGGVIPSPPTITLTQPAKDSTLIGTSVEFIATTTSVPSSVGFYLDNQLIGTMTNIGGNTWRYFLNTTFWSDGTHVISVIASNAAGEGADAGVYTFNNWDLNSLDITQPTSGSTVSGTINVIGDFEADDSGDYAELFVDDNFWASEDTPSDIGGGNMGFTFSLDTSILSEGSHQIKMIVYDPDGNKVMDMVMMITDNLLPDTPTIVSLLDGQYIEGMFTFRIQSDGTDLENVYLTIINEDLLIEVISNLTMGYNSASGYYELTVDTGALQDGNYTALAYAWDSAGNSETSSPVDFDIDNNAPILSVSSPLDNSMVSGNVNFGYTASDPFLKDVMYKIDGNSWVDIGITWNSTNFDDGLHDIKVRARDSSGHETTVTLTLTVDNNIPTVNINNPLPDQFIEEIYTFKIVANDDVGIDEVRITITNEDTTSGVINDIPIGYNSATGYYEYTLDTSTLEDGNYSVSSTSYDLSGQDSGASTVDFKIDNNAPTLTIISPKSDELLTGSVTINAQAEDVFLWAISYNVDNTGWVDIGTSWDTADFEDGIHSLAVKASDEAGYMTINSIEVLTDNHGPDIFIVSLPKENEHVGSSFKIVVLAMDIIDVAEISYKFDDMDGVRMFLSKETGFYEAEVITDSTGLGLDDGTHDLIITAEDNVGLSTSITRKIFVDNTGPDITIKKPTKNQVVAADVEFQVTVTDDTGVADVYIRIDKGKWLEMHKKDNNSYTYTWNSRKAYNGKYDIDVKAIDTLGNERQKSSTVTVDNFPWIGFYIFIIGLIVFLVLMIINWRKGSKPKKPAKEEEEFSTPSEDETVPELPEEANKIDEMVNELEEEIPEEMIEGETEGPPIPKPKEEQ